MDIGLDNLRMSIYGFQAQSVEGKLALVWEVQVDCVALSVQIATDSEFTQNERSFVLPVVKSVTLDCGKGAWFIRIGVWTGTKSIGTVVWSGIYGPVSIVTSREIVPSVSSELTIVHTQAIQHGLRLHTGNEISRYFVIEKSQKTAFPASATVTMYAHDWGKGNIDCPDLLFGMPYSVRFGAFKTENLAAPEIRQVGAWQVVHNKMAARPIKPMDSTHVGTGRADATLLREASQTQFVRFASHGDYLRFKAAETRTREERN